MASHLKVSGFSGTAATYKIVHNTDSDETADTDVTGTSGRIYQIYILNGAGTYKVYTKFKLTSGVVTPGTTEPDMMLVAGTSTSETYEFPGGLAFDQLSFWTTRLPATSDQTAPNATTVTILCT
tara:strand:+ start:6302 stop:6673 length:372 start_codon:yes stop_codon:yes gene_type:complete